MRPDLPTATIACLARAHDRRARRAQARPRAFQTAAAGADQRRARRRAQPGQRRSDLSHLRCAARRAPVPVRHHRPSGRRAASERPAAAARPGARRARDRQDGGHGDSVRTLGVPALGAPTSCSGCDSAATRSWPSSKPTTACRTPGPGIYRPPLCLIFGHERAGVAPAALDAADLCVELPVYGMANSLNVAMACALVGYEILRQQPASACSRSIAWHAFCIFR